MGKMATFLVILWLLNCATYTLFTVLKLPDRGRILGGHMNIEIRNYDKNCQVYRIYLCGLLGQPAHAFQQVANLGLPNTVLFSYSNFGFRVGVAAEQLEEFISKLPSNAVIELYTISLGSRVAIQYAWSNNYRNRTTAQVFINPCAGPGVLKRTPGACLMATPLLELAELASFLLGWVSVIPFIHTNDVWYSPALLLDQLLAIARYDVTWPNVRHEFTPVLILSEMDEYIDNAAVRMFFNLNHLSDYHIASYDSYDLGSPDMKFVYINTKHARTNDPEWYKSYRYAIQGVANDVEKKLAEAIATREVEKQALERCRETEK